MSSVPDSVMEEILKTRIRALEEDNERLKAENKRLRNAAGGSCDSTSSKDDERSDNISFAACTVGSESSLESLSEFKRLSTLRFKDYGFGLERLEWISKARIDQTLIDLIFMKKLLNRKTLCSTVA